MSSLFSSAGGAMGGAFGLQAVGAGVQAFGNIAMGNMAMAGAKMQAAALENEGTLDLEGAQFTADQLKENATTAIAAGQRKAIDTRLTTALTGSTFTARAAGSGLAATGETALTERAQIAGRGEYLALGEMAAAKNTAIGMENEAAGALFSGEAAKYGAEEKAQAALYSGKMTKIAADLSAVGNIAGGGASMMNMYGAFNYPTAYGRAGVGGVGA